MTLRVLLGATVVGLVGPLACTVHHPRRSGTVAPGGLVGATTSVETRLHPTTRQCPAVTDRPDPVDPFAPVAPDAPRPPTIHRTVQAPAAWLQAADIAPLWNALVAGVPDGTRLVLGPGVDRVGTPLVVPARWDLDIVGTPGTVLQQGGAGWADASLHAKPILRVSPGAQRVSVSGFAVTGDNRAGDATDWRHNPREGQAAIAVEGATDVSVSGLTLERTRGDGVLVTCGAERVSVAGNRITDAGRQGVAVVDAADVTVSANSVERTAMFGIDIEPAHAAERVAVLDNRVAGSHLLYQVAIVENRASRASDLLVARNSSTDPLGIGISPLAPDGDGYPRYNRIALVANQSTSTADGPGTFVDNASHVTVDPLSTVPHRADVHVSRTCPWRHEGPATNNCDE